MSTINKETKRIFIHMPKCAGTSMEQENWNLGNGHKTLFDYSKEVNVNEYFKWTFVRNPWDRLVSLYEYQLRYYKNIKTYEEFVDIIYNSRSIFNVPHCSYFSRPEIPGLPIQRISTWPQVKLISIDGKVNMDFIGRFEKIDEDWKRLLEIFNIPYERLGKFNARRDRLNTKNTFYKKLYDNNQSLIDKVGEMYQEDVDYFKYTFDT